MRISMHCKTLKLFRKVICSFVALTFLTSLIVAPVGLAAEGLGISSDLASSVRAQILPVITSPANLSPAYAPPLLLGLKVHPENPLLFDFIVDQGQAKLSTQELKSETEKLVKYFLAALTIPDKEVWVNLSPTEKDRIIPDVLGQTTMGKTMLEQDYLLKQMAASLTNPETELGKKYWDQINSAETLDASRSTLEKEEARRWTLDVGENKNQSTTIVHLPATSNLNKVWIMPAKAEVLESNGIVLIGEKRLKVMLAEDYEADTKNTVIARSPQGDAAILEQTLDVGENTNKSTTSDQLPATTDQSPTPSPQSLTPSHQPLASSVSSNIFRTTILPAIDKAVNESKDFAEVRQIYNSVILAAWYKKALKESLLGKVYADQGKVAGVETDDKAMKQRIYEQYLAAFKKGAYNLIKEEADENGDLIPRKYFSGGEIFDLNGDISSVFVTREQQADIVSKIPFSSALTVQLTATRDERNKVFNAALLEENGSASSGLVANYFKPGTDDITVGAVRDLTKIIFADPSFIDVNDIDLFQASFRRTNGDVSSRMKSFLNDKSEKFSAIAGAYLIVASSYPKILVADKAEEVINSLWYYMLRFQSFGGALPFFPADSINPIVKRHNLAVRAISSLLIFSEVNVENLNQTIAPILLDRQLQDVNDFWIELATKENQGVASSIKEGISSHFNQQFDDMDELTAIVKDVAKVLFINETMNALENGTLSEAKSASSSIDPQLEARTALINKPLTNLVDIISNLKNNLLRSGDQVNVTYRHFVSNGSISTREQVGFISKIVPSTLPKKTGPFEYQRNIDRTTLLYVDDRGIALENIAGLTLKKLAASSGVASPEELMEVIGKLRFLRTEATYMEVFLRRNQDYFANYLNQLENRLSAHPYVLSDLAAEFTQFVEETVVKVQGLERAQQKAEIDRQLQSEYGKYVDIYAFFVGRTAQEKSPVHQFQMDSVNKVLASLSDDEFEEFRTRSNSQLTRNDLQNLAANQGGLFMGRLWDQLFEFALEKAEQRNQVTLSQTSFDTIDFENIDEAIDSSTDALFEKMIGDNPVINKNGEFVKTILRGIILQFAMRIYSEGESIEDVLQSGIKKTDREKIKPSSRVSDEKMYDAFKKLGFSPTGKPNQQIRPLVQEALRPFAASSGVKDKTVASTLITEDQQWNKGGIDFDPTNMDLQIKRDGKGVPLPLPQQNLEQIHIQGLFPVIINIIPMNAQTLPIFLGFNRSNSDDGQSLDAFGESLPNQPAREPELAVLTAG